MQGNYPVVREDAAQMCALQMQAESGPTMLSEDGEGLESSLERYIVKQVRLCKFGALHNVCINSTTGLVSAVQQSSWLIDVIAAHDCFCFCAQSMSTRCQSQPQ